MLKGGELAVKAARWKWFTSRKKRDREDVWSYICRADAKAKLRSRRSRFCESAS